MRWFVWCARQKSVYGTWWTFSERYYCVYDGHKIYKATQCEWVFLSRLRSKLSSDFKQVTLKLRFFCFVFFHIQNRRIYFGHTPQIFIRSSAQNQKLFWFHQKNKRKSRFISIYKKKGGKNFNIVRKKFFFSYAPSGSWWSKLFTISSPL